MTDHDRENEENINSFESTAKLEQIGSELQDITFLFHKFDYSDQSCKLYQLVHPAKTCYSYNSIYVFGGRCFSLNDLIKRKYSKKVDQKPTSKIIKCNLFAIIDHLELIVVVGGAKHDKDVNSKYKIQNEIHLFPRGHCTIWLRLMKCYIHWRCRTSNNKGQRNGKFPNIFHLIFWITNEPLLIIPLLHSFLVFGNLTLLQFFFFIFLFLIMIMSRIFIDYFVVTMHVLLHFYF